tara:strand:- start:793 stop:1635 length:843 start_codon:yes stop_codon:yes gene_type:complete
MSRITINQALSIGQKNLAPITANYKNEVLWLMQKCLNINSIQLLLNSTTQELSSEEMQQFNQLIKRRTSKEPLQHILGSIEFYGYQFHITKDVFIPRPETEIFVDILKSNLSIQNKALEIGAGAGCMSILLELEHLANQILSIDSNPQAIALAQSNAQRLGCTKINFCVNDLFYMQHASKYDLIISNPPYISLEEIDDLDVEVLLYDPLNALTDYGDGLSFYQYFAKNGRDLLNSQGAMLFEFGGRHQSQKIQQLFSHSGYQYKIFNDLNNDPRFILIRL